MKKKVLIVTSVILLAIISVGIYGYTVANTGFDIDKTVYLTIRNDTRYNDLLAQVDTIAKIKKLGSFETISKFFSYDKELRVGRYAVTKNMNALDLVKLLRSGKQSPVKFTFNNIRTKEDFAIRTANQLELTKEEILKALNDSAICANLGFDTNTIVAMFIPNTYEFYWDVSLDNFLSKMNKEYKKFWTDERLAKAKVEDLTPVEISILASIVEEECRYTDEYPIVAGLYINRYRKGQALQADPTVKFAVGDFSLRRILNKHLEVESPYNTYRQAGLPPGPIRIPSIKGLDAALNYDKNNYYYMCAKEDFSGRHNFANSYNEHQINATKYRKALNERKIYQ